MYFVAQVCGRCFMFIPIPFEMVEPWAFLQRSQPNNKNKNKMSSDMKSVPDFKTECANLV